MANPVCADRSILRRISGRRTALSAFLCVALGACSLNPLSTSPELQYPQSLVSGERLFGQPVALPETPASDILALNDAMRAYVREVIGTQGLEHVRFRRLLAALIADGYFRGGYLADLTLTAAETFVAKGGNCLSYTSLFIALVREIGIDARYQVVDVPPAWDVANGFLVRYTHVNALVPGLRRNLYAEDSLTVDFNEVTPGSEFPRRVISDAEAQALFHANHAVALLQADRAREGFAHLQRALQLAPGNADLWINLAAFYTRYRDPGSAIDAYQVALQLEPRNNAALAGLARNYQRLGLDQMAEHYNHRARRYQESNPYYHFAVAQAAFRDSEFERSLDAINSAISLRRNSPRFYLLRALVQWELGHGEAAESSLRQAERYGLPADRAQEVLKGQKAARTG